MEARRFILVVSCVTVLFCVITVVYNFSQQPPLTGSPTAAAASKTASTDFYSLFGSGASGNSGKTKASRASSAAVPAAHSAAASVVSSAAQTVSRAKQKAGSHAASSDTKGKPSSPVNLNTATLAQLETLPGIGPVKAQSILDYRSSHGAFASVEGLDAVKGIGEKTIEKLKAYVRVG